MTRPIGVDGLMLSRHRYLSEDDVCFYFYEYTVGIGYSGSSTNQLILNFKKCVSKQHLDEYKYKRLATRQLAQLLSQIDFSRWNFVPVPPSKARDDELYDPRLEDLLSLASQSNDSIFWANFITLRESHAATHSADGQRKSPEQLQDLYEFNDVETDREKFIVFDDVLTSGAHFKAVKNIILEHYPNAEIRGLFIARSVAPEIDIKELLGL